jgi:hypothetical protein
MLGIRWGFFLVGVLIFSYGISIAIKVQHAGIHPWDVLNVALFEKVGLSVGSWAIIISILLIIISWILDKSYIKLGTFFNAVLVGAFVDLFLWLDILPQATHGWQDYFTILLGIVIMGLGGGVYNAAGVGSGPRDGFMLSIADKLGASIGKIRIIVETLVLGIGWVLGGPVFIMTFLFTFIQSPIFQYTLHLFRKVIFRIDVYVEKKHPEHTA